MSFIFSYYSPTKTLKGSTSKDTVSNEEFAKFMMSLQDSSHLVVDPSKTLSSLHVNKPIDTQSEHNIDSSLIIIG